ncbi:Protein arginine methyltransferase NDUFAF7, mitochondrial [Hypsizygus marmoreus]|uniref:Protein arginine methyltransferase NDUFAF7 n=1 Tax=Hypsizygus marmoreus TaxID=39966 RepID=A0A369K2X6_HYPMA|nr:Protein arginine methyltransferase NDUFAF7, mitochondrial [Hypsizygus marmoreus]
MSMCSSALRARHRVLFPLFAHKRHHLPTLSQRSPRGSRLYSENAVPPITKIEKLVLDSIKATGPLPFATYMQLCLSHPTHGYYMNSANPVFGSRGDFITSPEISQVFGELVGVWFLSQWIDAGRPPSIRLIELGPGRGTLMDDILRVISTITSKGRHIKDIHLVENSLAMREAQKAKLSHSAERAGCELHWHDHIDTISRSDAYSMVVAHEFFDALPFHVLQKAETGWHEVMIASNLDPIRDPRAEFTTSEPEPPTAETTYPRLRRVLSPIPSAASMLLGLSSSRFQSLPVGSFIEVSPASFRIARQLGELLTTHPQSPESDVVEASPGPGGCGLIIDYGGDHVFGDSFRAFKDHKIVDVFHRPGECDLTTNVDFAFLKEAMGDLVTTHGPIPQSTFLENMGLQLRVDALVRDAKTEERGAAIRDAAQRLVDRAGMGREYQVLGITSSSGGEKKAAAGEVWPFVEVKDVEA